MLENNLCSNIENYELNDIYYDNNITYTNSSSLNNNMKNIIMNKNNNINQSYLNYNLSNPYYAPPCSNNYQCEIFFGCGSRCLYDGSCMATYLWCEEPTPICNFLTGNCI